MNGSTCQDIKVIPKDVCVFAQTFYYKVERNTKSCTKVLGLSFAQYLCTGIGIAYNIVIERSSEYTVGVPQNSTKEGELYVYRLLFSPKDTCVLLKYV